MRRRWPTSWSCAVWLVVNFGERLVKDGIHRVVNGLFRSLVLIPELASAAAT